MPPRRTASSPSPSPSVGLSPSPSGIVASGKNKAKKKSNKMSTHERAGLVLPVSRIISTLRKSTVQEMQLGSGIRGDAKIYFVAAIQGMARALTIAAQKVAREDKAFKNKPVRTDSRHLIRAFDDELRSMAPLCGIVPQPKHAKVLVDSFYDHQEQARQEKEEKAEAREERKRLATEKKKRQEREKEAEEAEEGEKKKKKKPIKKQAKAKKASEDADEN
jgi:hypothetical protein